MMYINDPITPAGNCEVGIKKPDGSYTWKSCGVGTTEHTHFFNIFIKAWNAQSRIIIPFSLYDRRDPRTGWTYYKEPYIIYDDSGPGVKVPPPTTYHSSDKSGTINLNFELRKSQGEMIGSDYNVHNLNLIGYHGVETSGTGIDAFGTLVPSWQMFPELYTIRQEGPYRSLIFNGDDSMILVEGASRVFSDFKRRMFSAYTITSPPYLPGIVEDLLLPRGMNTGLITSTLAGANKKSMDAMTFLAEMPETILSIMNGLKLVAAILKDFKKKEFGLTKASVNRRKYLSKKLESDLASINRRRKGASKREAILLARAEKRARDTYSMMVKKSIAELADAIASVWMNYRYNIMPNVYAIEDIINIVSEFERKFVTERGSFPEQWFLNIEGHNVELDTKHRCMVKHSYDPNIKGTYTTLSRHLSFDVFTTSWELIPSSFVIDWFLNIGDLLGSLVTPHGVLAELSTYSTKTVIIKDITFSNNSRVVIDGSIYDRKVIKPSHHVGLVFKPDMNWMRYADSIAMLWPIVRKLLVQSKG